jgi:transposase-like protein
MSGAEWQKMATGKKSAAALALARGMTIKAAAAAAEVGERTLHRWLDEDKEFARQVSNLQSELFARAIAVLTDGAAEAAAVLRLLCVKGTTEKVRLSAARAVLELTGRLREMVQLEERLAAVEAALSQREKSNGTHRRARRTG